MYNVGLSYNHIVQKNTAKVVFSWGAADPADISLTYHGEKERGSVSLNLLGGLVDVPPQPSDAQNFTVAVNQVSSSEETTKTCMNNSACAKCNQCKQSDRYLLIHSTQTFHKAADTKVSLPSLIREVDHKKII